MTYYLNKHNLTDAKKGDLVWTRCLNTQRGILGTVSYSGPSSTPNCWTVDVMPLDKKHPVSPVSHACDLRDIPICARCGGEGYACDCHQPTELFHDRTI